MALIVRQRMRVGDVQNRYYAFKRQEVRITGGTSSPLFGQLNDVIITGPVVLVTRLQ